MAQFNDNQGRSWTPQVDAPTIRDIHDTYGIKLTDLQSDPFDALANDPCTLVDVLYILCEEQAKAAGVTDVEFGKAVTGDVIDQAVAALIDAVIAFFPPGKRSLLRSLATENENVREQAATQMMDRMRDPAMQSKIADAMVARGELEIDRLLNEDSIATAATENETSATNLTGSTQSPPASSLPASSA